jgi:hypothetical protein
MNVTIRGGGVAASCCAHVLGLHGIAASAIRVDRPPLPVVMISDAALSLVRDVFGRPGLFAGERRIDRRVVSWGGSDPVAMPHAATIVTGAALEAALAPAAPALDDAAPGFHVHAMAPLPDGEVMRFGERRALATEVTLVDDDDADCCRIESLEAGWLFLIPSGAGRAWLLCVGISLDGALAQSRDIASRIVAGDTPRQSFDPSPRIATQVTGDDWISCGTAAIAFDPICGDGTVQAVREAILAAAVIAAIARGGDAQALRAHYGAMLTATMRRHLQLCAPFYRSGGTGAWWEQAHDALALGHDWCTRRLAAEPEPRYMLRGYELVERAGVA